MMIVIEFVFIDVPNETIYLISSIQKVTMKRLEVKSLMKFLVNYLKGGV